MKVVCYLGDAGSLVVVLHQITVVVDLCIRPWVHLQLYKADVMHHLDRQEIWCTYFVHSAVQTFFPPPFKTYVLLMRLKLMQFLFLVSYKCIWNTYSVLVG